MISGNSILFGFFKFLRKNMVQFYDFGRSVCCSFSLCSLQNNVRFLPFSLFTREFSKMSLEFFDLNIFRRYYFQCSFFGVVLRGIKKILLIQLFNSSVSWYSVGNHCFIETLNLFSQDLSLTKLFSARKKSVENV